ncbi:MAG: shikimate kinase [Gemmatimonadaceae bacterium]|jgi:shikimate kinase|nr:shikimate kinase [Gemmatimonadaceae bacterium]
MTEQLVLVGLPGAGKSAVGRALAGRLGWRFVDLDEAIALRAGRSVSEIFATGGEPAFRKLEREMTLEYRDSDTTVLAPGGGWMAQEGLPALLRPTARIIHLIVSPAEAVARMAAGRGERPLLAEASDPVATLDALANVRRPAYDRAHLAVDTSGRTIAEVVDAVLHLEPVRSLALL